MKKTVCILLFTLFFVLAPPLRARAADPRLEVRLPEKAVAAGEEFAVSVFLRGNPGFHAFDFALSYDAEQMECTGVEAGEVLEGVRTAANPGAPGHAVLNAASRNPITGDGVLGKFTFRARKTLNAFSFALEDARLSDYGGKEIPFSIEGIEKVSAAAGADSSDVSTQTGNSGVSTGTGNSGGTANAGSSGGTSNADNSGGALEAENFTDTAGHWAEQYIREARARGLFGGYADGSFHPDSALTRAQYVTVLWNLAGNPAASSRTPFTDTAALIPNFRQAIAWAYARGYAQGTTAETFSPNAPLTRQAAMKILFGWHGGKTGTEVMLYSLYDEAFTDSRKISAWARAAMYWGVYNEILRGNTSTTLNPGGTVSRAQMAVILVRYSNLSAAE